MVPPPGSDLYRAPAGRWRAPRAGRVTPAVMFALALISGHASPARAEAWTLERVLDVVRAEEPGVRAARAAGTAARADVGLGIQGLSPRLSLDAGATRSDDPALLFSETLWQRRFTQEDFDLNRLNQPGTRGAFSYGILLEQPLFNGAAEITSPSWAAHRRREAAASEDAAVSARLLQCVEVFVNAVRARAAMEADSLALDAAREHARDAAELYRRGQVPELDTLRSGSHAEQALVDWLVAQGRFGTALSALSRLVGQPVAAAEPVLPDARPFVAAPGASADGRGEVRAAREASAALGIEATRATLRLLPSLNSRLSLAYSRDASAEAAGRRWTAEIRMDLPVWDGGRRIQDARAARARAESARLRATALQRDLEVEAEAARKEAEVSRLRLVAAGSSRASAEEALRLAGSRYRAGLLPLGELLSVDAEAAHARLGETDAAAQAVLSTYQYLHSIGELR